MTLLKLPAGNLRDWTVDALLRGELTLAGGMDLSYRHEVEIVFGGVAFVLCPTYFTDPVFREPAEADLRYLERQLGDDLPPVVVAFDHDEGTPMPGLIAAATVQVIPGTVHRAMPAKIDPGDRLAPWLQQ